MNVIAIFGICSCFAGLSSVVFAVFSDLSENTCCAISYLSGILFVGGLMLALYGFGVIQ